jgi:SAM-dependent methyltransferase
VTLADTVADTAAPRAQSRWCRSCGAPLDRVFVDLGDTPPSQAFLPADKLDAPEPRYPLDVRICDHCLLVQLPEYVPPEDIFVEYAYFSSFSTSWIEHARRYVEAVIDRFGLDARSRVFEVASNDGYLLQHFLAAGIPATGIEPARNVGAVAVARGIPTIPEFFSTRLAQRLVVEGPADLIVANNVFAHVPDLNDFTGGLKTLLAPHGVITIEVQHLVRLIEGVEFDTIYHEHFSYYTLLSAERVLARHGLRVFDVEEIPTHGGSLRLYVAHDTSGRTASDRLIALRAREHDGGYDTLDGYTGFARDVARVRDELRHLLLEAHANGRSIAGYGAPAKANTLLSYCDIGPALLPFTVDRNPYKHGRYTPGTHIPVRPVEDLIEARPDLILILPWNLTEEIVGQLAETPVGGAGFIVPIPRPVVIRA